MIGTIHKTSNGWIIKPKLNEDRIRIMQSYGDSVDKYPLHPDDVKKYCKGVVFFGDDTEVEFEIVEVCVDSRAGTLEEFEKNHMSYARIIDETFYLLSTNANRERLESHSDQMIGIMNDDKEWDEIFHNYQMDNYPPFGGPYGDAEPLEEWLKRYFYPPKRK